MLNNNVQSTTFDCKAIITCKLYKYNIACASQR